METNDCVEEDELTQKIGKERIGSTSLFENFGMMLVILVVILFFCIIALVLRALVKVSPFV